MQTASQCDRPGQIGPPEHRGADCARRRAEHCEDQDHEEHVSDLEGNPPPAQQSGEKTAVIVSAQFARKRES